MNLRQGTIAPHAGPPSNRVHFRGNSYTIGIHASGERSEPLNKYSNLQGFLETLETLHGFSWFIGGVISNSLEELP